MKPSVIARIRYVLNHFWLGSKLLYHNYKSVKEIGKKNHQELTRDDRIKIDQFRYDARIGIPFVAVFCLPFVGYTAPLLAFLAPKYLPSTLVMPEQKARFLEDNAKTSSLIISSLVQFGKEQFDQKIVSGIIPAMQFIDEVSSSADRFGTIISSIPKYSSIFHKSFSLSSLPHEHLLLLHKSVLHSSFIAENLFTNYSIESQLEMWQYRTFIDDKQIKNIDQYSTYDLVKSLYSRGLYLHANQMGQVLENEQTVMLNKMNKKPQEANTRIEIDQNVLNDWKQLLEQFIQIHKKLNEHNPISTSFLLHILPLLSKY